MDRRGVGIGIYGMNAVCGTYIAGGREELSDGHLPFGMECAQHVAHMSLTEIDRLIDGRLYFVGGPFRDHSFQGAGDWEIRVSRFFRKMKFRFLLEPIFLLPRH